MRINRAATGRWAFADGRSSYGSVEIGKVASARAGGCKSSAIIGQDRSFSQFDIVCRLMPRACAACSCVILASVLDFLSLPPISTRLPSQHELPLDYALCGKRCRSKRFYKAKFLCQNAFTFLCFTRNALIYLPIGSVISNTAPVSPLYARIVPLCR